MKCLFVRPPFAGWIVDGAKTIEYRSKATNIRGQIGIIQSMSGTVIGDVEIVGCSWNDELQFFEWTLANPRRYKTPLPFKGKSGAVVWIEVDYTPNAQEIAPKLSAAALKREKTAYEKEISSFLNPAGPGEKIECYWAVMKDGGEIRFETEKEILEGVGEAALVPEHLKNTTYSGFVIRFRDESHMDYYFKRFVFATEPVRNQILAKATNSANKNISQEVLSNLQITIPLKTEQEQIGVFLARLSDLITLHQRRSHIRQMRKKHFHIKYPSTWEQCKFGELCSIVTKQTGFDYTATIKVSLLTAPTKDSLPYLQTKNFTGVSIDYNTDYYIPKTIAKDFPKINLDVSAAIHSATTFSVEDRRFM